MRFLSPRFLYIPLFVMLCSHAAYPQPFVWNPLSPVAFVHPSDPNIVSPFTGGINIPMIQFVDINGDGKDELYVLDSDGRLNLYENIGDSANPAFFFSEFDLLDNAFTRIDPGTWFRFVDIDNDGDYDLFCNAREPVGAVKFYRNTGTVQNPVFTLEIDILLDDNNNPIISESISIPAFADADGDGDMDFFSGNSFGSIWYYENIDTTGQSFLFRYVTDQYQGIIIIGARVLPAGDTVSVSLKAARHGAMALDFADTDGDGDLDMFWGDLFNTSLYHLENTGTPTQPQFVLTDSTFPKPNIVQSPGFNMPQFVDIDNDGDLDMFIGVLSGMPLDNLRYYRNTGTAQSSSFELVTPNAISTIDHGAASSPVFADIDGDSDLDLMIGTEDGKLVQYNREQSGAQLVLSENPMFAPAGFFNVSPAFGDIDGDGLTDLIVGEANGRLHLFRGSNPAVEDTTFPLRTVSFGQNAAPVLVDFDQDDDLDLFVGTGSGRIRYYQNDGTLGAFNYVLVTDFFESIDVGNDSKPVLFDDDNDGDLDLAVGSRDSSLFFYRNDGMSFTRQSDYFDGVLSFVRTAPAFDDADGDGDFDLFLGNYKGGVLFYKNDNVSGVDPAPVPITFQLAQNYPNPFNPETVIRFRLFTADHASLRVYDVLGREVAILVNGMLTPGWHSVRWNAEGLASGVYLYRLQMGEFTEVRKALLVR